MIKVKFVDQGFKKKIARALATFGDMSDYFRSIAADWRKTNDIELFRGRTGPGQYKDLSPEYKKRKGKPKAKGGAGKVYPILLGKNSNIRNGITKKTSPYNVSLVGRRSLTVGIKDLPYAEIHQRGGKIRTKWGTINMPARPYIFNSKTGGINFQKQVERWMKELEFYTIRRLGGRTA